MHVGTACVLFRDYPSLLLRTAVRVARRRAIAVVAVARAAERVAEGRTGHAVGTVLVLAVRAAAYVLRPARHAGDSLTLGLAGVGLRAGARAGPDPLPVASRAWQEALAALDGGVLVRVAVRVAVPAGAARSASLLPLAVRSANPGAGPLGALDRRSRRRPRGSAGAARGNAARVRRVAAGRVLDGGTRADPGAGVHAGPGSPGARATGSASAAGSTSLLPLSVAIRSTQRVPDPWVHPIVGAVVGLAAPQPPLPLPVEMPELHVEPWTQMPFVPVSAALELDAIPLGAAVTDAIGAKLHLAGEFAGAARAPVVGHGASLAAAAGAAKLLRAQGDVGGSILGEQGRARTRLW